MINISVSDPFKEDVNETLINSAAAAALEHQSISPEEVDLSVVIEDNASLQELNRDYRDLDAPTDVLSFSLNEKDPETNQLYLGDVIISYQKALEQAEKAGHTVMAELELLTVHGILHLLGHDHAEPQEKEKMWAAQENILRSLKVEINKWPED
jgi:probable rRNA maturation factor